MRDMKIRDMKMRDMKIRDMNIRENEYAGQTYAKSNVYTTVQFSTVLWMSVNEINEIQINVQKSKNSYHQNLSTVLQFSSVQFTECQYKVKTILQLQQLVMRLMSRST